MTIDACVHYTWRKQSEVVSYMSRGWREYVGEAGVLPDGGGAIPLTSSQPYHHPDGDSLPSAYGDGGPPGSDLGQLRTGFLDPSGVERAVLLPDRLILAPTLPNLHLAEEICRAANDWTAERWLPADDPRLLGLVLVPNQSPEAGAAEIRRAGRNPRMAGILMGGNGLGRPFGHPVYHPIYEAAAELGLPVVVAAGGDVTTDSMSRPTAGGPVTTYSEYHVLQAHTLMTHMVSLIGQGVFARYPGLRLLLVGGGLAWVPSLIWRFDTEYRGMGPRDAPWLTELPSSAFHRHVRIATYPMDAAPNPSQLTRLLRAMPELADVLCYASGHPRWDTTDPTTVTGSLPDGWSERVLHDNALELFRWPA